ncbi:MAG: caspase family protein [Thermodesulfobacteriota bacterium]|nr:caspase family protein [Thermodesulfobacteriota bacterium]
MKRESLRIILYLLLFDICLPGALLAGEPPKEPILRIETGMHTARIGRISVDRENRLIATASDDKTVRIWDAGTGALIRVIRPPIGDVDEGKLYAVALSPDGKTVAAGGLTGDWGDGAAIYLFDAGTGALLRRLRDLPYVTYHLVFSRDGRHLAACLGGADGIRIYRTSDFILSALDKDYGGDIYGADFDAVGGLVTTSHDGYLRRYDARFRLLAKEKAPGGKEPSAVRFSPDGQEIALGFDDTTAVNVLSGNDLAFRFAPDTQGVGNGNLGSVAWSADGRRLYAGGINPKEFDGMEKNFIRVWSDRGRGGYLDIPATDSTIMDLQSRQGGGVFFAAHGAFGAIDDQGNALYTRNPVIGDYRNNQEGFQVSPDGAVVRFAYEVFGKSPAVFFLSERRLTTSATVPGGINLAAPRTAAPGLTVTDWFNTTAPKLNGAPLKLNQYEMSRSLAVAPDGETFLLGASWSLRLFNARGGEIWKAPVPETAWAVNISGDGRFALSAFGDGTIRWYSIKDGKEVLAFFPHKDQKRWVLWTPEGFFDNSEGGARLVGYHLNQGKDKEATFIPMENLYDVFYRPDIVATKFKGEDITLLIILTAMEALKNPPPAAEFTTKVTATNKSHIKVCYRISSKGGGIGEVRLFHNAKLIKSDGHYWEYARSKGAPLQLAALNSRAIQEDQKRGIQVRYKEKSIIASTAKGEVYEDCADVEAIAGENELSVAAFNKDNTVQGFLETMTFNANVAPVDPRVYVLIAGIDRYQDKSAKLNYAVKDAKDVHKRISGQLKTLFKKGQIHTVILTNEQVTRKKLLSTLDRLAKDIRPGDYFILFTAGHGVLIQNQYYLLTHDYRGDLDAYCMIGSNEIVEATKKIKSLNQLLIFDTCHAGGMDNIVSGLYDARMAVIAKKMGLHIYASASSLEGAMDGYKGNGLFTYHLLKGLDNNRDADTNRDARVSIVELGAYTKEQTLDASRKAGQRQTPMIINFGKDSPLYRIHN